MPSHLAVVDALEVGAGAAWLTSQPAAYLNNTQVRATTTHPDASTRMSGPPAPGPDLVQWAAGVAAAGAHPFADWVVQEARGLRPGDFPTRRLQGVYFRDQLAAAVDAGQVRVTEVHGTVVDRVRDGDDTVVVLGIPVQSTQPGSAIGATPAQLEPAARG